MLIFKIRYTFSAFIFILLSTNLYATVFPKEGSKLNYRLVGFSLPFENTSGKYKIEIAVGYCNNIDSFKKNIVINTSSKKNRSIIEVPSFGRQYTWRAIDLSHNAQDSEYPLYHFSTGYLPVIDSQMFRMRVVQHANNSNNVGIFMDAFGVLYDMKGRPIWYLPGIKYDANTTVQPRDMKLSPFGTITFFVDSKLFEINYNGDTIWKNNGHCPNNQNFGFHHEFTRLSNGHYMALGSENVLCDAISKNVTSGDLVELDQNGNVVWCWKSINYLLKSDIKYFITSYNGKFDFHDNSFYFDEQNKIIYLSYKNVDRIIKIKYPEGDVLNSYGKIYSKNGTIQSDIFHCQHAIKRSDEGYLYVFDNGCDNQTPPKLLLFTDPSDKTDTTSIIWEYKCDIKDMVGDSRLGENPGGGNVVELPDKTFFVSIGLRAGIAMIVNRDKQVLWSAVPETWDRNNKQWNVALSYRSSIITDRKDLEQLIWNAEKDQ